MRTAATVARLNRAMAPSQPAAPGLAATGEAGVAPITHWCGSTHKVHTKAHTWGGA